MTPGKPRAFGCTCSCSVGFVLLVICFLLFCWVCSYRLAPDFLDIKVFLFLFILLLFPASPVSFMGCSLALFRPFLSKDDLKKFRKAEYVQRCVCFVNVQSSLHENIVFSVCVRMCNAVYAIFIMWNSISGLDTCYHFRLTSVVEGLSR